MTMVFKSALAITVGICGTLFLGYCIYFDQQRRNDPNFKKKLKERRNKANIEAAKSQKSTPSGLPDFQDFEAVQHFFFQELQLGEQLLGQGDAERGVEHLGNAVAMCSQPQQLLQVLQQTLPPHLFHLFLQRLPLIGQTLGSRPVTGSHHAAHITPASLSDCNTTVRSDKLFYREDSIVYRIMNQQIGGAVVIEEETE